MRLSILFGVPLGQLRRSLSAEEWSVYQAADRMGLVPDWRRQQELMAVAANIDPAELFGERAPQDMSEVYEQRKRMHGSHHTKVQH